MIAQFTLSIVFVIVVLIIYKQVDFMITKELGINDKNLLNVRLQGMEYQKLANELEKVPGVVQIGGVSHALGTWADASNDYKRLRQDESFVMRDFTVNESTYRRVNVIFNEWRTKVS